MPTTDELQTASQFGVYLVEDEPIVLEAMICVLRSAGFVVYSYSKPSELLESIDASCSGCFVLDLHLPEMNGLELHSKLVGLGFRLPFIIVSGMGRVSDAVVAMRLGAIDFIEKPFNPSQLVTTVQSGLERDKVVREERIHQLSFGKRLQSLSTREQAILQMVVDAKSTKQIAVAFDLSVKTVEAHRTKIMRKLEVASMVELVRVVVEHQAWKLQS
jgi:two-component system, LuxR family, response regulator FixJ